jgi:hypothetical protein
MIFVVQLLIHGGAVCCGGGARIPLRHQKALLHDALNIPVEKSRIDRRDGLIMPRGRNTLRSGSP